MIFIFYSMCVCMGEPNSYVVEIVDCDEIIIESKNKEWGGGGEKYTLSPC